MENMKRMETGFPSTAVINLKEKGFISVYTSGSQSIPEGSQGQNSEPMEGHCLLANSLACSLPLLR